MNPTEMKELFTVGGCGILAQEILAILPAGQPALWKNRDGENRHAAILYRGRLLHMGELDQDSLGFAVATKEELDDATEFDFCCRIDANEAREVARGLAQKIVEEI